MASPLPRLTESLRTAPVIRLKEYDYFVHPITDGVPRVEPALLDEVATALVERLPERFDVILTPEAMGIPIASLVSLRAGKPFTIARKRAYGLPGEIAVPQRTGYGQSTLHVHGIGPGDRVVLVDDVASTGGTIRALAAACAKAGATLVSCLVVVNKGLDLKALAKEIGAPLEALVRLTVRDGRVHLER